MFNIKRFLSGPPLEECPDVPCGNKKVHYEYTDERMGCPRCIVNMHAKEKMEQVIKDEQLRIKHQEELAELIATKVVAKLQRVPTVDIDSTRVPTAHCDISPMADGNA